MATGGETEEQRCPTVGCDSAFGRNGVLTRLAAQKSKDIMLSEISQTEKDKKIRFHLRDAWNGCIHRDGKQSSGSQGLGGQGNGELVFNGCRVSTGDDEKVLEMENGDNCTTE